MTLLLLWITVSLLIVMVVVLAVVVLKLGLANRQLNEENQKLATEAAILSGSEPPFEQAELLLSKANKAYRRCYKAIQKFHNTYPELAGLESSLENLQRLEILYRREQRGVDG